MVATAVSSSAVAADLPATGVRCRGAISRSFRMIVYNDYLVRSVFSVSVSVQYDLCLLEVNGPWDVVGWVSFDAGMSMVQLPVAAPFHYGHRTAKTSVGTWRSRYEGFPWFVFTPDRRVVARATSFVSPVSPHMYRSACEVSISYLCIICISIHELAC